MPSAAVKERKSAGAAPGKAAKAKKETTVDAKSLVAEVLALEGAERAKTGSQNSWVSLATGNSAVLSPKDPKYIKSAKLLDYVIADKKLRLGPSMTVTILGMFKLYQETPERKSESDMPPIVGYWLPADAEQIQTKSGDNFTRQFTARDGTIHELNPVHWVHIYIHGHEDITDAILPFRSRGNEIYRDLYKLVKRESRVCPELRFKVTSQGLDNAKYKKTDYYPAFEIVGRNFRLDDEGNITLVKDGFAKEELADVLLLSRNSQKDYAECRMVSKRDVATITGTRPSTALPPGQGDYDDVPDEEDDDLDL
jgi:hypothetical protein